jgi:hypothetical protein
MTRLTFTATVKEMKKVILVLALVLLAIGAVLTDGFGLLPPVSTRAHHSFTVPNSVP